MTDKPTKEEQKELKDLQEQCLQQFEKNVKEGKLDNPNKEQKK